MSLKCKWVTGSQQCATVRNFCATPSARVDSMSSLHCKPSSRTTCRRLWSSRSYLLFWNVPHLRSLTTETLGESSLIFHHCRPVRVRQNDREREFVSQVLVHAHLKKKMNLDRTAVRLYDFLSCAGPRSSHQWQRFSTSHVVFYTWVRPHPAERARCCIDRYRPVLIGTSMFNQGSFKFFAIRMASIH